ncbi:MAG: S9 family peptidase [Chloroflexota bacterium]
MPGTTSETTPRPKPQGSPRIESLLAARLFLSPQVVGNRLYFLSNLSGRLSLYVMDVGGSMPEPLLPPHIALQNPELAGGYVFYVFPALRTILVMLDHDGDENYQPMVIPLDGGFPEPAFGDQFADFRCHCTHCDDERGLAYFSAESRREQWVEGCQGHLASGRVVRLGGSAWEAAVMAVNRENTRALLMDSYTSGDTVLYLWQEGGGERRLLYGTPLEDRAAGGTVPLTGLQACAVTPGDRGVLCVTSLFVDTFGLGYLPLSGPPDMRPVAVSGTAHSGIGEMTSLEHIAGALYLVGYNIDGCSWYYEGEWDEEALRMVLVRVICGRGATQGGVLESIRYDRGGDRYALAFSTATSPMQLFLVEGAERDRVTAQTRERVLGVPQAWLSGGEDASFTSFDGQRVSARLYLPAQELGFQGRRPLVYYVHGGPQSQERPDFAWFSMPLIQFLTLHGFAVFVPNARGSTGYGLSYTKRVDRDWGGQDRLDHIHALEILAGDPRVDTTRAGVVGRSYGGYMTLTLATRHPHLWSAAVDMFGPYDLLSFMDRIPATWKNYFALAVGDPQKDRDFLVERSPRTYVDALTCPLLVIQGANDPRVVEQESRDVVEHLQARGKAVEYLLFEDEGHDVLKFTNRVRCYNAITDFFTRHLRP